MWEHIAKLLTWPSIRWLVFPRSLRVACPRSSSGHVFPFGRLCPHTQPDAAPLSFASHGTPKALLLVFHLRETNILVCTYKIIIFHMFFQKHMAWVIV